MAKLSWLKFLDKHSAHYDAHIAILPKTRGPVPPAQIIAEMAKTHIAGDWAVMSGDDLNKLMGRKVPRGATIKSWIILMAKESDFNALQTAMRGQECQPMVRGAIKAFAGSR